jgi:hypothetical protein
MLRSASGHFPDEHLRYTCGVRELGMMRTSKPSSCMDIMFLAVVTPGTGRATYLFSVSQSKRHRLQTSDALH